MSFDSLKLNKQIVSACKEAGFMNPKDVQSKCINRFEGGQDWVVQGPEGCGKTTTYILSIIMRLKYAFEEAPRAVVLVHSKDKITEVLNQFELLTKNTDLRVIGLYSGSGMQDQRDDIFDGVDVVVGTPDRVNTIYLQSGLNLSQVKLFVLDDADLLIKQGYQGAIYRLVEGLPKCQKLAFTEVYHDKLDKLLSANMNSQGTIEIKPNVESQIKFKDQSVYNVLNYKTKLNLLNHICQYEQNEKLVIFCQTRLTAGQLYNSVSKRIPSQVAMLKALFYNQHSVETLEQFLENPELTVLIHSNEDDLDLSQYFALPEVIHFDVPEDLGILVSRGVLNELNEDQNSRIFATDLELGLLKKIENQQGVQFEMLDNPIGMITENNRKRKPKEETDELEDKQEVKKEPKKNLNTKDKIKLFGKARKKRGKHKK